MRLLANKESPLPLRCRPDPFRHVSSMLAFLTKTQSLASHIFVSSLFVDSILESKSLSFLVVIPDIITLHFSRSWIDAARSSNSLAMVADDWPGSDMSFVPAWIIAVFTPIVGRFASLDLIS